MGSLLGKMVGYGLATVLSPIVFVSMFLMLTTAKPVRNGWIYVSGLLTAVAVTTIVSAFLLQPPITDASEGVQQTVSWFGLIMGLFELGLGLYLKIFGKPPGEVELPKFATRLETIKPVSVFFIGVLVPTFPAAISCGVALATTGTASSSRGAAVVLYILVCAIVVAIPLVYVEFRGKPAQKNVRKAMDWLVQRSSTVGAWLLIAVGIYLILQALPPIT